MKIKCLIIDDEPLAREGLAEYVKQIDFLELSGLCDSAMCAIKFIKESDVDLIFLDIQMPVLTGLDFVKTLPNLPKVIFTTAHANYALQGFELNAVDYLLKPISFERFLKAVNKVADSYQPTAKQAVAADDSMENDGDFFFIKTDKKYVKINFDDIYFIEGVKDYVKIHTTTERHLVLINIKNIQMRLPEGKFMRVHKSYIVPMSKIATIEGNMIKIAGMEVPVGKEYREQMDDFIRRKLMKRNT